MKTREEYKRELYELCGTGEPWHKKRDEVVKALGEEENTCETSAVYKGCEEVNLSVGKYKMFLWVAQGSDGLWRASDDFLAPTFGWGSSPGIFDRGYDSREKALKVSAENCLKKMERYKDEIPENVFKKVEDFINGTGQMDLFS